MVLKLIGPINKARKAAVVSGTPAGEQARRGTEPRQVSILEHGCNHRHLPCSCTSSWPRGTYAGVLLLPSHHLQPPGFLIRKPLP